MRAEFFPDQPPPPPPTEAIETRMRRELAARYPILFRDLPPSGQDTDISQEQLSDLLRSLSALQNINSVQADRFAAVTQRMQEMDLSPEAQEAAESIIYLVRSIHASTSYIGRGVGSLIPMLKSMSDFLNSDNMNSLTDPSLSMSERVTRTMSIFEEAKNFPGLKDGLAELEAAGITGISGLVTQRLDSFMAQASSFHQASDRPKLPDLSQVDDFTYQPLKSPTSIRILRVDAQPEGNADTNPNLITTYLDEVNLAEDPNFNALSYVWGDHRPPLGQGHSNKRSTRCFNILCNGRKMSVTYNLFCFLRRLAAAKQGEPLHNVRRSCLWVDQLCVNQSDDAEKVVQVAMMDHVYSRARLVVSWLGEGDSHVDGAARLVSRLADIPRNTLSSPSFDIAKFVKEIPSTDWLALGAFLARPYFKRAWIVQEIAMAGQLLVVCGKHIISWDDLIHCSAILEESKAWTMLARYVSIFRSVEAQISSAQQPLRFGGQLAALLEAQNVIRDGSLPPANLLLLGRQFDATVTADKFFALLGLHRHRADTPSTLLVDYSRPLLSIAFDFAKYHIQSSNTLALLSLVEDPALRTPSNMSFPSWLPDPAAPLLPVPFALPSTPLSHPPIITPRALTLYARHLTTITAVAPPFSTLFSTGKWHLLFDFVSQNPRPDPSTLKRGQVLWRVLTATPPPPTGKAPAGLDLDDEFHAWCISLVSSVANTNLRMADPITAETTLRSLELDDMEFDVLAFGEDARNMVAPEGEVVDDVLKRSELMFDYMERRMIDEGVRDDGALARQLEIALDRVWNEGDVFPGRVEVRRGREVLDTLNGDVGEEGRVLRGKADVFRAQMGGKLEGRRVFCTGDGRLGLGGQSVEEGDEVWELDGAGRAVIRRYEGGRRFVGLVFVFGDDGRGRGFEELVLE